MGRVLGSPSSPKLATDLPLGAEWAGGPAPASAWMRFGLSVNEKPSESQIFFHDNLRC